MQGMWTINGKDLYTQFGVQVLKGSYGEILSPPALKERLEHDFPDRHGVVVDTLSPLVYMARTYKINVLLVGADSTDFWAKYKAFFAEIATPEPFTLHVADLGVRVTLLYTGANCTKKPRSLKSGRVAVAYEITVNEYNPHLRVYDND